MDKQPTVDPAEGNAFFPSNKHPGGPRVLAAVTRPTPTPVAGYLLVRIDAAGVNGPDIHQRRGDYPPPPGAPDLNSPERWRH